MKRRRICMHFPQIVMQSEMGRISIEQPKGVQEIEQPKADLSIEQPKATLTIRTVPGKLTIDQTQAWEETNLISAFRQTERFVADALDAVKEGASRRAEQGDQLMRIENGGDPIYEQALENVHDQMKSISLKYMSSPFSVKIHYDPAQLNIDVQTNEPIIQAHVN